MPIIQVQNWSLPQKVRRLCIPDGRLCESHGCTVGGRLKPSRSSSVIEPTQNKVYVSRSDASTSGERKSFAAVVGIFSGRTLVE
jgi:hypothetical protein